MEFDNIVLIHRENNKFIEEGFSISIDKCFENIKSFYKENGKIFLVLSLEEDFTDEVFDEIIENLSYEDFEKLGIAIYPKDEEYYPTFVIEMENKEKYEVEELVSEILDVFTEKVIKIYCNNM